MFWRWLAVFGINILLMGYYWTHPVRIAAVMLLEIAAILITNPRKKDWIWVGLMGVLAPVVDLIVVPGGGWIYPATFFGGIPVWLPLGYIVYGLIVRRMVDDFPKMGVKK